MAIENYKEIDNVDKRQYSKMRPSYLTQAKHINDNFKNLGYEKDYWKRSTFDCFSCDC